MVYGCPQDRFTFGLAERLAVEELPRFCGNRRHTAGQHPRDQLLLLRVRLTLRADQATAYHHHLSLRPTPRALLFGSAKFALRIAVVLRYAALSAAHAHWSLSFFLCTQPLGQRTPRLLELLPATVLRVNLNLDPPRKRTGEIHFLTLLSYDPYFPLLDERGAKVGAEAHREVRIGSELPLALRERAGFRYPPLTGLTPPVGGNGHPACHTVTVIFPAFAVLDWCWHGAIHHPAAGIRLDL